MLGSLVEAKKTDVPGRSEETVEREYVDEDESDEKDEDDSRRRSHEGKLRQPDDSKTNELVGGANDTALERASLPWDSAEASRVHFDNGVLEVRLRPEDP